MNFLPNPFDSGATDWPPDEAATAPRQSADVAADLLEAEISLSELCHRGFDVRAFMDAIDEPPLFLRRA
jgi:hypothetical protein